MKAQRGEAASVDGASPEVRLGVGAVDGAAAPPQAACRLAGVVGPIRGRRRRSRQGEESAGLGHGVAERHAAHAVTDEVEEVAVGALGGIGPLAGDAWGREADEERAPAGAVKVAGRPVPPLPAAVGQVGAADLLGALAEGLRDPGGVHAAPPLRPESARVPAGLGLLPARGRRGGAQRTLAVARRDGTLFVLHGNRGTRTRRRSARDAAPRVPEDGAEAVRAAMCCCAPPCGMRNRHRGREVALDEQLGDGRAHGARILDRHGACGIVVEVDVVDPVIGSGVGGPLHDGADGLAVRDDEPFVIAA